MAENLLPMSGLPNSVFPEMKYKMEKLMPALHADLAASACSGSIKYTRTIDIIDDPISAQRPALAMLKNSCCRNKKAFGKIDAEKNTNDVAM